MSNRTAAGKDEPAFAAAPPSADLQERIIKWMNMAMCWLAMQASDAAAFRSEGDELIARLSQPAPTSETAGAKAVEALGAALQADFDWAWSWHCNLAMLAVDSGANHHEANQRAAEFMDRVFGTRICQSTRLHKLLDQSTPPPPAGSREPPHCQTCNCAARLK